MLCDGLWPRYHQELSFRCRSDAAHVGCAFKDHSSGRGLVTIEEFPRLVSAGLEAKHMRSHHDKRGNRLQLWLCLRVAPFWCFSRGNVGLRYSVKVSLRGGYPWCSQSKDFSMSCAHRSDPVDGTPSVLPATREECRAAAQMLCALLERLCRKEFMSKTIDGSYAHFGALHEAAVSVARGLELRL